MEMYKMLLKEYKDKVIDNYEDWFAKDVLLDISEIGGFDTLIDDNYEFLFNVDVSKDLHNIINNLLNDEEISRGRLEEWEKILIQLIKLKRITDKRILESKAYDEDYVNEYIFEEKPQKKVKEILPLQLNNKLLNPEILVNDIYTFLFDNEYIECSIELFKKRFFENLTENEKKINWKAKQLEMAAFMQLIFDYNIISSNSERKLKVRLTIDHFNFDNREFKSNSLRKEFSEFKKDETLCPEIRKFFEKLQIKFK